MCLSDHQIQAAILRRNPSSSNLGCKYMKHGSIDLNWFNICSDIYLQLYVNFIREFSVIYHCRPTLPSLVSSDSWVIQFDTCKFAELRRQNTLRKWGDSYDKRFITRSNQITWMTWKKPLNRIIIYSRSIWQALYDLKLPLYAKSNLNYTLCQIYHSNYQFYNSVT